RRRMYSTVVTVTQMHIRATRRPDAPAGARRARGGRRVVAGARRRAAGGRPDRALRPQPLLLRPPGSRHLPGPPTSPGIAYINGPQGPGWYLQFGVWNKGGSRTGTFEIQVRSTSGVVLQTFQVSNDVGGLGSDTVASGIPHKLPDPAPC